MRRMGLAIALLLLVPALSTAGEQKGRQRFTIDAPVEKVEEACVRALDYLEGQQQPEGFWQNNARTMRVETTTWALLAFLANGQTPQAGPYRRTVEKGLAWLMQNVGEMTFGARSEKAEHLSPDTRKGQALFVFLCALGMDSESVSPEDLAILCERGVAEILKVQRQKEDRTGKRGGDLTTDFAAGGFGRVEESYWLTLCLLAARQTGIRVPDLALESALEFWRRHYQPQHGKFYDEIEGTQNFGNVAINYGCVFSPRCMILLALLGDAHGKEAQGGVDALHKLDLTDREWWWNFGGGHYGPNMPSPMAKHSTAPRNRMQSLERFHGERYLALKLSGIPSEQVEEQRELYSTILLANQTENGAFRFPGWEFEWPVHMKYGTANWVQGQGYGEGWTETMITAQAACALALPKAFLPAFNPWEKRP